MIKSACFFSRTNGCFFFEIMADKIFSNEPVPKMYPSSLFLISFSKAASLDIISACCMFVAFFGELYHRPKKLTFAFCHWRPLKLQLRRGEKS